MGQYANDDGYDEASLQQQLTEIYKNISQVMPVSKIGWIEFYFDFQRIGTLGQVSEEGGERTHFMYEMPGVILSAIQSGMLPPMHVINQPEKDLLGKEIGRRSNLFDWSGIFIFFSHPGSPPYGAVMMTVEGKEQYTNDRIRRIKPFLASLQAVLDFLIHDNQKRISTPLQKENVIDKNDFFRQATVRLCGNLDLQTGVSQTLRYLSRFIPADALFVKQLEPDLQSNRGLAESYGLFHQQTGRLVPWSALAPRSYDLGKLPEIRIINQPEHSSFMRAYTEIFGKDISCISMPLIQGKTQIGMAVLGLEGRNRYQAHHMHLFALLHDPFVLALSNNIKHRELVRLTNILNEERKTLKKTLRYDVSTSVIGETLGLKDVMEKARLVARQDSPVLLLGETGVGKEVIANYIHQNSSRSNGPFIKVNCGAIPDSLVDSELFGHEKGAFTNAKEQKKGRFERANHGTIFLDEVGELPLHAQVRLLRVLQNKVVERVGGEESISIDIRIIAATHRDLEQLVAARLFRQDLWFRLNVFPIHIPPLRSRRIDVPALVDHFIDKKSVGLKFHNRPTLSPMAMQRLITYAWPGNVRELENVVERELILSEDGMLAFEGLISQPRKRTDQRDSSAEDSVLSLDEIFDGYIKKALKICQGRINGPNGAAHLLQVNPSTLRNRMKKMNIPFGMNAIDSDENGIQ